MTHSKQLSVLKNPELDSQLETIIQSEDHILIILLATFLSYYTVDVQRKQLICTATDPELCQCLPDVLPIRKASGILIVYALCFFTRLSAQALESPEHTPKQHRKNEWNHLSNLLVLTAAVIHFGLLLQDEENT